jgi:hypothetical protein
VLPENIAHAFLTTLFLLSGQWTAFFLNAPLVAFNANKCVFFVLLASLHPNLLQNTRQKPHVRRDRDIPDTAWAQKGELHQARLLPALVLLLPLSVRPFTDAAHGNSSTPRMIVALIAESE